MADTTVRIAMNGVTGRMGQRQHLVRSLLALRDQGGLDTRRRHGDPARTGARRPQRAQLRALAERHGLAHWSCDLDAVLGDDTIGLYFDAQVTAAREEAVQESHRRRKAPLRREADRRQPRRARWNWPGWPRRRASRTASSRTSSSCRACASSAASSRAASSAASCPYGASSATGSSKATGSRHSAPPGTTAPRTAAASRPTCSRTGSTSCDELFGPVRTVQAHLATHLPRRWDESGTPYEATADDAAYGVFELPGGIVAQINSSWAVRVHRDELVEFQVDGTEGSRRRRTAPLPCPAPRRHPQAGVEPRPPGRRAVPRAVAGGPRQRRPSTTPSRRSGSCSCGMSSATSPGTGTWRRAPAASSSPNWACGPRRRAAAWTCRS